MVFPGQGSQSVGMLSELAASYPKVEQTFSEASDTLGYDLWRLVSDGPAEELNRTDRTQPAMLAAGVAAWRVWVAAGGAAPSHMAGHSLGEYTALVCSGAIGFSDAMRIVKRRSELMQAAVPVGEGAMAAIIGLEDDAVREVCAHAGDAGVAEAVNFNAPGQVVIAGHAGAVAAAVTRAEAAGARRAIVLPVSVPSHSSLMTAAGEELSEALAAADFRAPDITVVAASDARPYADAADIRERLSKQVYRSVQWVDTVQSMLAGGATRIVECGPGKVLAGLVRRIDRKTPVSTIDSLDGLGKALQAPGN